MRVKALTGIVGGPGATWFEGEEFDLDDQLAAGWLAAGHIAPVGLAIEAAVSPLHAQAEKAIRARPVR